MQTEIKQERLTSDKRQRNCVTLKDPVVITQLSYLLLRIYHERPSPSSGDQHSILSGDSVPGKSV